MNVELYQPTSVALTTEQAEMLTQPLSTAQIKHRPGAGGRQLAYISAKTAIDTANKIFGFGKWGYRLVNRSLEKAVDAHGEVVGLYYSADIELFVVGAAFPFPGDGIGIVEPKRDGSYTIEAHETARKGAVRDALKRALIHYGDRFGLCLSDEDAYVQAPDGSAVQVKAVSKNGKQPQGRRVIDAKQPQTPPTPDQLLARLKKRAVGIGITDRDTWNVLLHEAGVDGEIKNLADLAKVDAYIASFESQKSA